MREVALTLIAIMGGGAALAAAGLFMAARLVHRPADVGTPGGLLAPCPGRPNCVSSLSGNPLHKMPPISYSGTLPEARARLGDVIRGTDGATVITETDDYLYVEFRSALFRFVDDVEFRFHDRTKVIHFRSASRLGYSDHGVNRRRMERITQRFRAAAP